MRVGIYARVSTVGNGQSPEMQLRESREYCERRGWSAAGEYVDVGISGAKDSRPELNRLVADAHRRRFDAVVVWKFDRFARSVSHLLRALETFKALGIEFVSLSEQIDTSTPTGRMIFTVLGAVAELERSLIAERVRAGLRNARAKGKRLGRPCLSVDASKVAALRASGLSYAAIAKRLGVGRGHSSPGLSGVRKKPRRIRPRNWLMYQRRRRPNPVHNKQMFSAALAVDFLSNPTRSTIRAGRVVHELSTKACTLRKNS